MGIKGIVLGAFAVCFGGLLLFSDSFVAAGLGLVLITLVSAAVVSRYELRRASRPRG
ncbi:hypothetical protein [Halobellus sp. GM3]|uniref:hypothetical protein n=1 Tax=Halobellus sp. GM3 TaxID=3458410 RepID=UPI00403DA63B